VEKARIEQIAKFKDEKPLVCKKFAGKSEYPPHE
jgi:hypothetical protein